MGVAAVIFTTLGEWLGVRQFIVPAVGVREGILHDLAAAHFGPATAHDERAEALRQQARRFAGRMHSDAAHGEQVRRLAAQLFDQLAPVHGLAPGQRVPLELAALLHDVGFAVNAKAHHKHGEYLVRNADIPGLSAHQQSWSPAWCDTTARPRPNRITGSIALSRPAERQRVRQLASLLRMAVALDAGAAQAVRRVEAKIQREAVWLASGGAPETPVDFRELRRKARSFETEFNVQVRFTRQRKAVSATAERSSRSGNGAAGPRRSAA